LSADEDILSQKVRSLYAKGGEDVSGPKANQPPGHRNDVLLEETTAGENGAEALSVTNGGSAAEPTNSELAPGAGSGSRRDTAIQRETSELAGGLEDWQN